MNRFNSDSASFLWCHTKLNPVDRNQFRITMIKKIEKIFQNQVKMEMGLLWVLVIAVRHKSKLISTLVCMAMKNLFMR